MPQPASHFSNLSPSTHCCRRKVAISGSELRPSDSPTSDHILNASPPMSTGWTWWRCCLGFFLLWKPSDFFSCLIGDSEETCTKLWHCVLTFKRYMCPLYMFLYKLHAYMHLICFCTCIHVCVYALWLWLEDVQLKIKYTWSSLLHYLSNKHIEITWPFLCNTALH